MLITLATTRRRRVAWVPAAFSSSSYLFTLASIAVCYHYSALCSSLNVTLHAHST